MSMKTSHALLTSFALIALALGAAGPIGRGARPALRSRAKVAQETYAMTEGLAWAELEDALAARLAWTAAKGTPSPDLQTWYDNALAAWQEILQERERLVPNPAPGRRWWARQTHLHTDLS